MEVFFHILNDLKKSTLQCHPERRRVVVVNALFEAYFFWKRWHSQGYGKSSKNLTI